MEEEFTLKAKVLSRRFFLATIFTCGGTVALFLDKLTGTEYYWLAAVTLGVFGASEILKKKFMK